MEVSVYNLNGEVVERIKLPEFFNADVREDLILRCVLAFQANRRQPYGADPLAGKRTSAHYHGRRDRRWTMMNRELSRLPRLHNTSPHLNFRARFAPQAVKGRRAHPPKAEKKWEQKVNRKEKRLATISALAATCVLELVKKRGHRYDGEVPIVVVDDFENLKKTKEVREFLEKIGLKEELKRAEEKKIRAGKGKMRGRKYRRKKSLLIVIGNKDAPIKKAANNLPGIDVVYAWNLNVEHLAPGAHPGRLTLFTKSAIEELKKRFGEVA